jgi:hypothetical protein
MSAIRHVSAAALRNHVNRVLRLMPSKAWK